jgi:hypothetical protein
MHVFWGRACTAAACVFLGTLRRLDRCRNELMDAFAAIGVNSKPQLVDILMHQLEKDERGRVDYRAVLTLLKSGSG